MMAYPLSYEEALIHRKRLKGDRISSIVGSHGHYYIREVRTARSIRNVESDVVIMHGRSLGRHTHNPNVKRETVRPKPRILA